MLQSSPVLNALVPYTDRAPLTIDKSRRPKALISTGAHPPKSRQPSSKSEIPCEGNVSRGAYVASAQGFPEERNVRGAYVASAQDDLEAATALIDSKFVLIWISEHSFKPSHAHQKEKLESLGCSLKCYKSAKNAERALEKKSALERMVFLVSPSETNQFISFVSGKVSAQSRIVKYRSTSEFVLPGHTVLCVIDSVRRFDEAYALLESIFRENDEEGQEHANRDSGGHQTAGELVSGRCWLQEATAALQEEAIVCDLQMDAMQKAHAVAEPPIGCKENELGTNRDTIVSDDHDSGTNRKRENAVYVGQRVYGYFYGEWHQATVIKTDFSDKGDAMVLWDSEFSRSTLAHDCIAPMYASHESEKHGTPRQEACKLDRGEEPEREPPSAEKYRTRKEDISTRARTRTSFC